jgi:four helix bundle protein
MKISKHEDLEVYQLSFRSAMKIYDITLTFPKEEKYSLTDQIRRSSRSVCANIAEAFFRRKYPKNFSSHISDSIAEAAETRVWLDFTIQCNYYNPEEINILRNDYSKIIGMLIVMHNQAEKWKL